MDSDEKQTPPLWSELEARIEENNVSLPQEAMDLFKCITAPKRRDARIKATSAAIDAAEVEIKRRAEARGLPCPHSIFMRQWLVMMDLNGIGGLAGAGGSSQGTDRMRWASDLGSGRWHARDGGAYADALRSQSEFCDLKIIGLPPYQAVMMYLLFLPGPDDESEPNLGTGWVLSFVRQCILSIMDLHADHHVCGISYDSRNKLESWCHMLRVIDAADESGDTSHLVGFVHIMDMREVRTWM